MTQFIKKLPAVFQTVTEKKFFDATFDQVFTKKDSDYLAGYLGRRNPGQYNPITDFYIPEPSKNRTWWQLEATAFAREEDSTKSNIFFYDDLLEHIEYYGGNTLNQDRLFESEYYSFGPPIDYDMFINYQNYYWVEQGLPNIEISGVTSADIIGQVSYTTPVTATPANFTISSGMTITLLDDPAYNTPHRVENIGDCVGIRLLPPTSDFTAGTIFEFLPWDGFVELANGRVIHNEYWDALTWDTQTQPITGDYITIERGSVDNNAWSRTNKWFHIDTINATIAVTNTAFPTNATRALRPIIQFIADLTLYKSGTQFRSEIQYGFRNNFFGQPMLLATYQGQLLSTINSTLNITLAQGDLVCFFNDPASNSYIYEANIQMGGTVLFTEYTSVATPVLEGDIVLITDDAPYNGAQSGSTWYYSLGEWQQAFNDKIYLNQPPLFQLYDHNGIPLDDEATYPESSFRGSEIFSYKVSTEPGATVDPVLKFPLVYTSFGQASDIVFQNDLIVSRYVYGELDTDIDGYYYYKTYNSPILWNNWNLFQPCLCDELIPTYQVLTASALQTVFDTIVSTVSNSANQTYLQVYVNGVYQQEIKQYTVTGPDQITFNVGLALNDEVVIYSYNVLPTPPDYEEFISAAAQTIFNTAIVTTAAASNKSYLQVYVNGVEQGEGPLLQYTVTGANQITFNVGLSLLDDVVIIGYSPLENPPDYDTQLAALSQTVFNTAITTAALTPGQSYLQVYVNGVFQQEGLAGQYVVTGINQITFNSGLGLNDTVTILGVSLVPLADECPEVSKQRVIDQYAVGYGSEYQFRLSVTPVGYPAAPDIIVSVNGSEVLPYPTQSNGYTVSEINGQIFIDLEDYLTNLLITPQSVAPVVQIQTYTHGLLDPAATGYFEIPQQLEANPSNLEVGEISASNLIQHFSSIISNQVGFTGVAFGNSNNFRDTEKNRSVGTYILQNVAPTLKSMLVSSEDDLSFIKGVRFSSDEYTKFKNKYIKVAQQLIDQEFNPVQYYNNSVVISLWVEEILKIVNISKEFSNAFAYSYMIANGSPIATETAVVPIGGLISLTNYVDLSDPRNALYIYDTTGQEQLLAIGTDYEIVYTNAIIDIQFTATVPVGNTVYIALYKNPLPAYIPSTPTKVGAYPTSYPRIQWDATYTIPTWVIVGHDGSKTIAYPPGDYRNDLLLELERRIYNLLEYRFRNQYAPPLVVEDVKSGYYRQTRYSRDEYLEITESYLNKWSAKNRANYRANDWDTASTEPGVVPSFVPGVGNIWKLYNYSSAIDAVTGVNLGLPGNWKGIFQYYYDTYNPDTQPWNMLGFSEKPVWWEFEYGAPVLNLAGQEVWTSTAAGNNDMWEDLEKGIIRQGPSAIFDPITLEVQPQKMWTRPGLSTLIPVDAVGEIIPVMTLFNVAFSGNFYAPYDGFDSDWKYGAGAPVEQAWMSTSAYAFSVQEFLFLMKPGPYGELMFDTVGTELSPGTFDIVGIDGPVRSNINWQYVQNDTYTNDDPFFEWMRPKNKDQIVHAETIDNIVNVRFGYQRWVSDRILFLGKNVTDVFGQKVRTLDVNLANKLAGFTNKDTTATYLESISSTASNNLLIPSNNFEVFLHKSPSVDTYVYTGAIIRALADGTFMVYGYDLLSSEFTVLDRTNNKLIEVTVGGEPAEFQYFTPGTTYNKGDLVRYNGIYYISEGEQTPQKFISSSWQKLKALPITGGISATYKPVSATTTTKIPYGSVLRTVQEVFDFLIGLGAYQESRGWQFKDVNQDTNIIDDWLNSAKQFLFWLNSNWAPDASIQLSPLANKATLIVSRGYPDDVETISNGVYSILDKFGVAISPQDTSTDREGQLISVSPATLAAGGIYFLQVNVSETEHVLIFDNTTNFNDVVYAPLLRVRQARLRFNGFRSNGWYGKLEAPGYLVIDDQLVPNFDSIVADMRYYYDANVTLDNPSIEDLGRHLIGYESKSYLDNLELSNDVQYLFYRGFIRQKGTEQALTKLFRSTKVQANENIEVFEEWALKLGDFGNTVEQVSTEFILRPEQNTGEVIVAKLNYIPSTIGFVRQINILNAENTYINVPRIIVALPDADPFDPAITEPLRAARAFAVLDANRRISRIDITDPGYGYTEAPSVTIDSGSEPHNLDRLFSVWQGQIVKDVALDNIIDIDIDQVDVWTVRPQDPAFSLEFPTTPVIDYPIPNAGYVHFDDVDWYSFDVDRTAILWGTNSLNPGENETVWIANTFTQDWDVYKLVNAVQPTYLANSWRVQEDTAGNLLLLTNTTILNVVTSTGNGAVLYPVIDVNGNITSVVISDGGAGYVVTDTIVATRSIPNPPGYVDTTFTFTVNIDGSIDTVTVIQPVLPIPPLPQPPSGNYANVTFTPQFWNSTEGERTDFGNMIVLQQVINGDVNVETNYAVTFIPYSTEDYNLPGTYTDPDTLVTYNAYSLQTLIGTPITANDIGNYEDFTDLLLFKTMRWRETPVEPLLPTYVGLGDYIWVDDVAGKWAVFEIQADPGFWDIRGWDLQVIDFWSPNYGWDVNGPMYFNPRRVQEELINSSLFESANVFSTRTRNEIVQLPVYDPFKNILPGPAKQNLTYVALQDPARYNVTGDERLFSENINFGPRQVGQLWWDTSSTRFVYYEQPRVIVPHETLEQRLASESKNLIYRRDHWGQIFPGSTINIYEWVQSDVPPAEYTGTGTPRDITSYVQIVSTNRFTNIQEVKYYFWVLNATDKPNIENRTMAAADVSRLLQNPKGQGFAFFAPIQQYSTYNAYIFYNVQEILAYQGDNVQIQYRLGIRNDQEHAQWKMFREGDRNSLVTDQYWNKMVDSLCGYTKILPISDEYSNSIIVAYDLPWDIYGWDIASWDSATDVDSAVYGEVLPVPDPTLSEAEKFGIEYRPRQGMFVNLYAARKIFVQAGNELLRHIPIRDDNPGWNDNVSTSIFWKYTNWYKVGYENAIPNVVFQTLIAAQAALTAGALEVGDIVQVTDGTIDGRFVLYVVAQLDPNIPVLSLEEVGTENSAIELLDTIYTSRNLYSLAVELRQLLDAFRTQVFVNEYIVDQNELFFSMVNYVLSEQKNPDWVFKTSYIYIREDQIPLTQTALYTPNQIDNILDYINSAKPYHTKIRDYTSTYTTSDLAFGTASDSYLINSILTFGPENTEVNDPGHWDAACDSEFVPPLWGLFDWGGDLWGQNNLGIIPSLAWDNYAWDACPGDQNFGNILTALTFADDIDQLVSREDVFTVSLTFFDSGKIGYSQLFPYTFNILELDGPQTFITPENVVAIQVGDDILHYGQDYYVEYNTDTNDYTVYFYNDPGAVPTPVAYVWFNGGGFQYFRYNTSRNEVAYGFPVDNLVTIADTKLPISNDAGLLAPYATSWADADAIVQQLIIGAGGTLNVPPLIIPVPANNIVSITYLGNVATVTTVGNHGITLLADFYAIITDVTPAIYNGTYQVTVTGVDTFTYVLPDIPVSNATAVGTYYLLLDNNVSARENRNSGGNVQFYRNAERYMGTLVYDLPAPTDLTENIDVITVFVDPSTHPITTNILPDPLPLLPGVIWIGGERIEYRFKELVAPDTWELRLVRRGTAGTAPTLHTALIPSLADPLVLVSNPVWIERGNLLPVGSDTVVWNATSLPASPDLGTQTAPNEYTSITSVPVGGIWYSDTPQAVFLRDEQGTGIP